MAQYLLIIVILILFTLYNSILSHLLIHVVSIVQFEIIIAADHLALSMTCLFEYDMTQSSD